MNAVIDDIEGVHLITTRIVYSCSKRFIPKMVQGSLRSLSVEAILQHIYREFSSPRPDNLLFISPSED